MKRKLFALGVCSLSFFAACVGAEDADMVADDGEIGEAQQALCVSAPSLDSPSTTQSLALHTAEVGDGVERTSPDATYASSGDNVYVTEITGFPVTGYNTQAVFASHAEPPSSESLCGFAKVEASYTCYDPAQSCWVDCGSNSALGTWVTSPLGNHCEVTTSLSVPVGYTKVRVAAKATTFALLSVVPKKVKDGGYWYN